MLPPECCDLPVITEGVSNHRLQAAAPKQSLPSGLSAQSPLTSIPKALRNLMRSVRSFAQNVGRRFCRQRSGSLALAAGSWGGAQRASAGSGTQGLRASGFFVGLLSASVGFSGVPWQFSRGQHAMAFIPPPPETFKSQTVPFPKSVLSTLKPSHLGLSRPS